MKKLEEKEWKYWIPSAGRAENIKTVDYLLSIGVPKENINIMYEMMNMKLIMPNIKEWLISYQSKKQKILVSLGME